MKAFKKLSNLTSDKDYVLIYYSGHGDIKGNNSYWVPVDGEKEYGLGDWINISEIQNYIREEIPNHHIVLMSDSCYFAMETKGNEILKKTFSILKNREGFPRIFSEIHTPWSMNSLFSDLFRKFWRGILGGV